MAYIIISLLAYLLPFRVVTYIRSPLKGGTRTRLVVAPEPISEKRLLIPACAALE